MLQGLLVVAVAVVAPDVAAEVVIVGDDAVVITLEGETGELVVLRHIVLNVAPAEMCLTIGGVFEVI